MFMPTDEAPERAPAPERLDVAESLEQQPSEVPELQVITPDQPQTSAESDPRVSSGQTTDSPVISPDTDSTDAPSVAATGDNTSESASSGQNATTETESSAADSANAADSDNQAANEALVSNTTESEAIETAPAGNLTSGNEPASATETDGQTEANRDTEGTGSAPASSSPAAASTGEQADVEENGAAPIQQAELAVQPPTESTEPTESTQSSEPTESAESSESAQSTASVDESIETESVVASVDAELQAQLESPSWILVQDENLFTIQMSASRDLASVENFLRRNPLPAPNSIFSFEREGDVWYALVHGIFSTIPEAQRFVEQLPSGAQRDQPWIRSIARLKQILRAP